MGALKLNQPSSERASASFDSELSSTVEGYLQCILLEERQGAGRRVSTGRVSAGLGVSPASVTGMLLTLQARGLVDYQPYRGVRLAARGRRIAVQLLRRHRLIKCFLVDIVGMDWSEVHSEAERLEHAVSPALLDHMDRLLGHPVLDPHGGPIPSPHGAFSSPNGVDMVTCPIEGRLQVSRIRDQRQDFLRMVEQRGVTPGRSLRIVERDHTAERIRVRLDNGSSVALGFRAGAKIEVRGIPG